MKSNIKSLGWFIRFAPVDSASGAFYEQHLGFPLVRRGDKQAVDMFWAGEALIFEIIFEATVEAPQPDPDTADCFPVFRVTGLDGLVSRLRAAGAKVVAGAGSAHGREAFIIDPLQHVIGLRERDGAFRMPFDIEARRRRARGEAFNPGCKSMPEGLDEMGWIVRRVHDLAMMAAFYETVLGLRKVGEEGGRVLLDLGDNAILELAPGGVVHPLPANRREVPNVFILRTHQAAPLIAKLRAHNVRFVHDLIQWDRGALSYFADPEGNLVGFEERYHPSRYAPAQPPFPEDLETERRWRELAGPVEF